MRRRTKIAIGVLIGLAAIIVVLRMSIVSIRIELPPAEPTKTEPAPPVFVAMNPDGRLTVDGSPTTLDTLTQDVSARFVNVPKDQQRVMIRATGEVKYDRFMAVLNRLKDHGWIKVGLIKEDISTPEP